MTPENDKTAWFAKKRYGYGAGMPIAWQGWALLAGYVLLVLGAAQFIAWDEEVGLIGFLALFVPATAAFLYVSAIKTQGGWSWRWGDDD